jgi:hypothetical protein
MILFTYLCSKICLPVLLNTPAPVGTTLRCRCNSRRFEAGVPEKNFTLQIHRHFDLFWKYVTWSLFPLRGIVYSIHLIYRYWSILFFLHEELLVNTSYDARYSSSFPAAASDPLNCRRFESMSHELRGIVYSILLVQSVFTFPAAASDPSPFWLVLKVCHVIAFSITWYSLFHTSDWSVLKHSFLFTRGTSSVNI